VAQPATAPIYPLDRRTAVFFFPRGRGSHIVETYTEQLYAIVNAPPTPTKSRLIHNAKILAVEADQWKQSSVVWQAETKKMKAIVAQCVEMVRQIVADGRGSRRATDRKIRVPHLAGDPPEPNPNAPPPKGEMH
jgi:hypothetical protein